ncbi:MAG: heavy metal response regulator transcription factor [Bdellovibrionota bacterium]
MRLLIIEDEKKTSGYLKKGLTEAGYVVDVAYDGEDGLHLASTVEYSLIILDILLPKLDGWSVLEKLRRTNNTVPVIFLTARDSVQDRVQGLELGADDYLIKPFAFSEFLARVRSVLRRSPSTSPETLKIADLEINFTQHKATRSGKRLDLTPKEFMLLALLARRHGEVLLRTVIAEQVWDLNFDSDTNVIDVHVRRLRAKLDDPFERKLIHTIRGAGYALEDRG